VKGKVSLGTRRQAILLAALAAVLVLAVVRWRPGGSAPGSASGVAEQPRAGGSASIDEETGPARGGRRLSSKEVSPDEVPVISRKDFDAPPSRGSAESGRDLFDLREPTRVPPPTATPRPPVPGEPNYIGPLPPPPPTPTPKPPEVSFKFLGSFGPKDQPIAVIQQGDEVFNARAGDTLFGKFVIRRVGYESIDVGFVGFAPSETRRLGITP
jgi:hypothetical protein